MSPTPDQPQLASMAVMVREDGQVLMLRHAIGPFAGLWSMPFIGIADHETAEDGIERLMRETLHVEPGPYEFLDTLYVDGEGDARFVVNAFTCVDWEGEPRFARGIFDDAVWAPPGDPRGIEVVPQVRDWLLAAFEEESGDWGREYEPAAIIGLLTQERSALLAAYEAIPGDLRHRPLEEDWAPLDVLCHAVDVEAYYIAESRRGLGQPGHMWRLFNSAQWEDLYRLRPPEDESILRERMVDVRDETRTWLESISAQVLAGYVNHPERGVVQIGDRVEKVARHDREHAEQLRRMAQAAAVLQAAEQDQGE